MKIYINQNRDEVHEDIILRAIHDNSILLIPYPHYFKIISKYCEKHSLPKPIMFSYEDIFKDQIHDYSNKSICIYDMNIFLSQVFSNNSIHSKISAVYFS